MARTPKPPHDESTLAALLREKPRRGRPRHAISRQSVYLALSEAQKEAMARLAQRLPPAFERADVPDLAIGALTARLDALRRAVADRSKQMPEGITDIKALYYLWDLPAPTDGAVGKWTSIRLSPVQIVNFGRLQGMFKALFGSTRSEVFGLALATLVQFVEQGHLETPSPIATFESFEARLNRVYL